MKYDGMWIINVNWKLVEYKKIKITDMYYKIEVNCILLLEYSENKGIQKSLRLKDMKIYQRNKS